MRACVRKMSNKCSRFTLASGEESFFLHRDLFSLTLLAPIYGFGHRKKGNLPLAVLFAFAFKRRTKTKKETSVRGRDAKVAIFLGGFVLVYSLLRVRGFIRDGVALRSPLRIIYGVIAGLLSKM